MRVVDSDALAIGIRRDADLLRAARGGDEVAFRELVSARIPGLQAHCYRMLGSAQDAEDAVQDTLLRAWRGLQGFQGRSSLSSWLYRIATNVCLRAVERRRTRVLPPELSGPLAEVAWLEPYPDELLGVEDGRAAPDARYEQREAVELAFVAALQHLPPNQRAALLMREVLGFSARETAESLGTTTASVNSALQHARTTVSERIPAQSQQATLRSLGDQRLRTLVEEYTRAMERADLESMLALLSADATWSMPPFPDWYRGTDQVAGFLAAGPFRARWRHLATRANGQPAIGWYRRAQERGSYSAFALDVLTLRGDRIAAITAFVDSTNFVRFGLPDELPA
jgi:RNA polymerase sigma-70 factor (ECF subfamily)